jgi:micrococcal nuclease|tara:strand:+ start:16 stop:432 length:417 start_codon:yes stop_codon:yes gene_type:complete
MYEYNCKVERVVDGDTVDVVLDLGFNILHKCRVRLYGIDTPESRTRNKDEKIRGKMAGAFLENSINAGDKIIIRTELKDSRGKFGRVLGTVIADGVDINVSMIENYHAVKYYGQSKQDVAKEHLINKQHLIDAGLLEV